MAAAPVAKVASEYIYQGIWTNWNKGPVIGLTLTMNPRHAQILTAALALAVGIAGAQLWRIFQFFLHQRRATSAPRSILFHLTQVILRNPATDLNTLWRLLRVGWAWRHQRGVRLTRILSPLIIWSLLHLVLVALGGVFVSKLLLAGSDVLSVSPYCGSFKQDYLDRVFSGNDSDYEGVRLAMEYNNHMNSRYAAVEQHINLCGATGDGCDTLPLSALPKRSNIALGYCPFPDICHPSVNGTLTFDTGLLSSHAHLGFNAAWKDRISFRFSAQCVPLNDQEYVTGWHDIPATADLPAHQVSDAFYGPSEVNSRNATFSITKQVAECDERQIRPLYALNSQITPPGGNFTAGTATFNPRPELRLMDADLSLILLSFNGYFEEPVLDPWFCAQEPVNVSNYICLAHDRVLYTRQRPLTTIACTQQWQICNTTSPVPRAEQCTSPTDLTALWYQMQPPQVQPTFTSRQTATANRLMSTFMASSPYYVIMALSQATAPPLKARMKATKTAGPALPPDQWIEEVGYWMDLVLAYIQQNSLDYSTGQFAASTSYINVTRPSPNQGGTLQDGYHWLCQRQMIHSDKYLNYNFFALVLVSITCMTLIPLGLWIDDIVACYRMRKLEYSGANGKQLMWNVHSDLWLLRLAAELKCRLPFTDWNMIPVTHIGYEVSINDLMPDSFENVDGRILPRDQAQRVRAAARTEHSVRNPVPEVMELRDTSHRQSNSSMNSPGNLVAEQAIDDLDLEDVRPARRANIGLAVTTEDHLSRSLYETLRVPNERAAPLRPSSSDSDFDMEDGTMPHGSPIGTQRYHSSIGNSTQSSLRPMLPRQCSDNEQDRAIPIPHRLRSQRTRHDDLRHYAEHPSQVWMNQLPQRLSGLWRSSWRSGDSDRHFT